MHQQLLSEWVDKEKDGPNAQKWPSKKRSNPTPSNNSNFFDSATPYSKDNPNQK
jgi:hypothetical protein